MRRLITSLVILVSLCAAASALDWGGSIDNVTTVRSTGTTDWEEKLKLALWLSGALAPTMSFDVRGAYVYEDDRPYLFDVEEAQINGRFPEALGPDILLGFTAGRSRLTYAEPLVFDHTADGLVLRVLHPSFRVEVIGGYTGLLLKPTASVSMSAADLVDDDDDDVLFAPRRLVTGIRVTAPEIVARQSLGVAGLAQVDLRKEEDSRLNTEYATLYASGPIVPGTYYQSSLTLQTAQDKAADQNLLGLLATLTARYYNESLLYSRVSLRGLYASGDSGSFDPFIPVSEATLGLANQPPLSNLMLAEASYSLKPLSRLANRFLEEFQLLVRSGSFFETTDWGYLGTEIGTVLSFRPVSDFGAALSGAVYLPDGEDAEYALRLEASFAF